MNSQPTDNMFRMLEQQYPHPSATMEKVQTNFSMEQKDPTHMIPTLPVKMETHSSLMDSQKSQKPVRVNDIFTPDLDQKLKQLAVLHRKDWKKIASKFENKSITPRLVRDRYTELFSGILKNRVKFSHREDLLICKYFKIHGTKWELMVQYFLSPQRDAIMLKNRYYAFIRKQNLLDAYLEEADKIEEEKGPLESLRDRDVAETGDDEDDIDDLGEEEETPRSNHEYITQSTEPTEDFTGGHAQDPNRNLEEMEKPELIQYIKFLEQMMFNMQCNGQQQGNTFQNYQ